MFAGRLIIASMCGLLLMIQANMAFARVTAEVDRSEIAMGETLRLTLKADGGERPDTIDTSGLTRDFEILQRSSSTSARVIGGEQNVTRTLEIELLPLREGIATIPAFSAGGRRTTPIAIKVNSEPDPGLEGELVYFDASVDKTEVYVQAQVILTITLQQAINLDNRAISELDIPEAYQEALEQRNFQRRSAGRLWQVTELRYALFPQKSGTLAIPAIAFSGRELLPGRSLLGARLGRRISIKSDPISIQVRPAPADFPGDTWLPAQSLEFTGAWSAAPDALTVGDSTTRTLKISATGLQGSQLPPITSLGGTTGPNGLRFYPDQETIDQREVAVGLEGFRTQSEALVSSTAGSWLLPELVIPWWNTETDTLEYARLPAETITVSNPATVLDLADTPSPAATGTLDGMGGNLYLWQWLAGAGWVLALAMGWRLWSRGRGPTTDHSNTAQKRRSSSDLVALKRACTSNDPQAAREAVLGWANNRINTQHASSLDGIASHVGGLLAGELRALDQTLFAQQNSGPWQGAQLFRLIRDFEDRSPVGNGTPLDLYPSS